MTNSYLHNLSPLQMLMPSKHDDTHMWSQREKPSAVYKSVMSPVEKPQVTVLQMSSQVHPLTKNKIKR